MEQKKKLKVKRYKTSYYSNINKDAKIQFNFTDEDELHVGIVAFGKRVSLKKETFELMVATYKSFLNESK